MGMFDWVNYRAPCIACGFMIGRFQSKDGPCEGALLDPSRVSRIYNICPKCEHWNAYRVTTTLSQLDRVRLRLRGEPTHFRADVDYADIERNALPGRPRRFKTVI